MRPRLEAAIAAADQDVDLKTFLQQENGTDLALYYWSQAMDRSDERDSTTLVQLASHSRNLVASVNYELPNEDYVRVRNRWKSDQYLHIEHGALQSSAAQSYWYSAQWLQEPILGTDYVRIANRWKPDQYLHIEQGSIESSTIELGWHSAQWKKIPIPGTNYVKLQNRWKPDQHLHIERGSIESSSIASGWHSAQWVLESDL